MTAGLPLPVLLGSLCLAASLGVLGLVLVSGPDRRRRLALAGLRRGTPAALPGPEGASRSTEVGAVARLAGALTLPTTRGRLAGLLHRAGQPSGWSLERLLVVKLVLPAVLAGLGLLVAREAGSPLVWLVMVVAVVVSRFLPELLLHSRAQERSEAITLALADTLDQMTIAVEAGLGFDAAMSRAARNGHGPLAQELGRTLQDVQLGRSRREAYTELAARTGSVDLRRFVRAVVQADGHGVSIADTLRTQAAELRLKRRQRAEERAMQIPVKVVFPLMLFILPVLFIVLLGPAALDIADAFS